jgi:hypothetical protein
VSEDFYLSAARQRANEIEVQLSAAKTELLAYRQQQDLDSAGEAVQRIANLTAEQSNLRSLCDGYIAAQQRQPEQLTAEERAARPWHKMDYNDTLALAQTSKYGKNLDWNDPNMRAGYAEAPRRRSRGE